MNLLVVYDPNNQDACTAADIVLYALGPGERHQAGTPLPHLDGRSIFFVGPPPAHVLVAAHQEAAAVAVVAKHMAGLFTPADVIWVSGWSLEQAARDATGVRKHVPTTST